MFLGESNHHWGRAHVWNLGPQLYTASKLCTFQYRQSKFACLFFSHVLNIWLFIAMWPGRFDLIHHIGPVHASLICVVKQFVLIYMYCIYRNTFKILYIYTFTILFQFWCMDTFFRKSLSPRTLKNDCADSDNGDIFFSWNCQVLKPF